MPLSVAEALRGVLQQDPDLVMVDELDGPEAASEVARAAARGRLMLVAVAARDARSARRRLVGPETTAGAAPLLAVVVQRLVPRPCLACEGQGCDACDGRGVCGRTGRFEITSGSGR